MIDALEHEKIYAFHFFVGHVTPKLSINGELWRNGYFAEWQLNRLLSRDFDEQEVLTDTLKTLDVDDEDSQQDKTDQIRSGRYKERDLSAAAWFMKVKPDIEGLTNKQIENALLVRNRSVWEEGFTDWNRKQKIWPQKKRGLKRALLNKSVFQY